MVRNYNLMGEEGKIHIYIRNVCILLSSGGEPRKFPVQPVPSGTWGGGFCFET